MTITLWQQLLFSYALLHVAFHRGGLGTVVLAAQRSHFTRWLDESPHVCKKDPWDSPQGVHQLHKSHPLLQKRGCFGFGRQDHNALTIGSKVRVQKRLYTIVSRLGTGSFAEVFLAVHKPTGDKVAVKQLHESERILHSLDHEKQVLQVVGEYVDSHVNPRYSMTGKVEFLAMRYWEGDTMAQLLNNNVPDEVMLRHRDGASAALAKLHQDYQVLHRDAHMENVIVGTDGQYHWFDFGRARIMSQDVEDQSLLQQEVMSFENYINDMLEERREELSNRG